MAAGIGSLMSAPPFSLSELVAKKDIIKVPQWAGPADMSAGMVQTASESSRYIAATLNSLSASEQLANTADGMTGSLLNQLKYWVMGKDGDGDYVQAQLTEREAELRARRYTEGQVLASSAKPLEQTREDLEGKDEESDTVQTADTAQAEAEVQSEAPTELTPDITPDITTDIRPDTTPDTTTETTPGAVTEASGAARSVDLVV